MTRLALLASALSLSLIGCGGSDGQPKQLDMGGEDGTKIATLIEDINDSKGNAKKFAQAFVKGSAPSTADAKKFNKYAYFLVPSTKPSVNGGEATAKVSIQNDGGGEIAQKEWTFTKDGDAWKIKSAPLP